MCTDPWYVIPPCTFFRVSEQRRKRLKELEDQLTQVRKKMTEQSKMLKMKEQTDKQIKHLFTDINVSMRS